MDNKINIHFLGDITTGSKYLIEALDKIIMVDCGLFQGPADWAELERHAPPVRIEDMDLIVFPHAHLDPREFLPGLLERGFKGQILAAASRENTPRENVRPVRQKATFGAGRTVFHGEPDLEENPDEPGNHFREAPEGIWIELDNQVRIRFQYNDRMQEYVFIELDVLGERLFLSGDIGRRNHPTLLNLEEEGEWHDTTSPDLYGSPSFDLTHSGSMPESSFWLG